MAEFDNQIEGNFRITGKLEVLQDVKAPNIDSIQTSVKIVSDQAIAAIGSIGEMATQAASDNYLTVTEKQDLYRKWEEVKTEYPIIRADAIAEGLDIGSDPLLGFETAYTALRTYLITTPGVLADTTVGTEIVQVEFLAKWEDYYAFRNAVLTARLAAMSSGEAQPPTNNVTSVAFSSSQNADGSIHIEFSAAYSQGTNKADGVFIYYKSALSAPGAFDLALDKAEWKQIALTDTSVGHGFDVPARTGGTGGAPLHYRFGAVAGMGSKLHTSGVVTPTGWDDKTFVGEITDLNIQLKDASLIARRGSGLSRLKYEVNADNFEFADDPESGAELAQFRMGQYRPASSGVLADGKYLGVRRFPNLGPLSSTEVTQMSVVPSITVGLMSIVIQTSPTGKAVMILTNPSTARLAYRLGVDKIGFGFGSETNISTLYAKNGVFALEASDGEIVIFYTDNSTSYFSRVKGTPGGSWGTPSRISLFEAGTLHDFWKTREGIFVATYLESSQVKFRYSLDDGVSWSNAVTADASPGTIAALKITSDVYDQIIITYYRTTQAGRFYYVIAADYLSAFGTVSYRSIYLGTYTIQNGFPLPLMLGGILYVHFADAGGGGDSRRIDTVVKDDGVFEGWYGALSGWEASTDVLIFAFMTDDGQLMGYVKDSSNALKIWAAKYYERLAVPSEIPAMSQAPLAPTNRFLALFPGPNQNSSGFGRLFIQFGETAALTSGAANTITFPSAFKTGTVPIVIVNPNLTSTSSTGTGIRNFAYNVTNSQFVVYGAGIAIQWVAFGLK